jgi:mannosyltransferase OCH1-like enzyme
MNILTIDVRKEIVKQIIEKSKLIPNIIINIHNMYENVQYNNKDIFVQQNLRHTNCTNLTTDSDIINYINNNNIDVLICGITKHNIDITNTKCSIIRFQNKNQTIRELESFKISIKPVILESNPSEPNQLQTKQINNDNYLTKMDEFSKIIYGKLLSEFIYKKKIIKIEKIERPSKKSTDYIPIVGIDDTLRHNIIPKKIYKVFVNDTIENLPANIFTNAINIWAEMYPEYELIIYDSNKIYDFLMQYYGKKFVFIYDMIIPHAFKCDFFRYCLLYKEGGVYSDLKQVPIKKIDIENYQFIASYEKHIDFQKMLGLDFLPCQNCFIACVKEHPYIKSAIDMCIQNILKKRYNSFCTDVTGPVMLGRCIKYVRENIHIDYNKELFFYFYAYRKNDVVEFYINEHDDLNAGHIIKHKFDNSNGADWTILNKNNNYAYLWHKRNIYNETNFFKKTINNYYRFDNSYSKLYEFSDINHLLSILSKLNLIILYKTILDLEYLNYNFTMINIIDNNLLVNNQLVATINMSEEDIINEIVLISKNYIIISDDDNIKNNYDNVINVSSYEKYINNYFDNSRIDIKDNFIYGIKPYFIYFPQFHTIPENNINFYDGYTDTNNLFELNNNLIINKNKLCETPCFKELEISEYNLLNINLLQKQIDILKHLNLPGFAMYYYWFDINTITNKNMIFKDVIDSFFNKIDMKGRKIFFIWANENWSDTIALSNPDNNHIIKNTYSDDSLIQNAKNLINYFTNECYLKIDNKPVFYIYHSWKMSIEVINKFYSILNNICIESGFNGIYFYLNTMFSSSETEYNDYNKFYLNVNYKNNKISNKYYSKDFGSFVIDYYKYINSGLNIKNNQVNTLFFNFDNRPRFYKPDKLEYSTFCVNNCELNKYLFAKSIIEKYKDTKSENQKILLINAWNEWGENMVFEPSNEFGYYNLNLLFSCL